MIIMTCSRLKTIIINHNSCSNQEADDNDGSEQDSDNENNDNILNSLFEMTGIQSAIQHDQIVDSAGQERMIVDREGICVI
jgi:DNA excision repair protein ERCC-6